MKATDRNAKLEKRGQVLAMVSTAMFFIALIGLILIHDSNKSLEDLLNKSRLTNESNLSEKLSLDKQILDHKAIIASLKTKNSELEKLLASANADLAKARKEGNGNSPRLRSLEKELADIKKLRNGLEKQIASLENQVKMLEGSNDDLTAQLASMESRNKDLNTQNELIRAFASNNYRIEAMAGRKDKLTIVAKRTKSMKLGFDLPQSVAENVKFKIKTPDGKVIESEKDGISATILDNEDGSDLMVSLTPVDNFEVTKRIEMKYQPTKKLQKGLYTIDIYNGSNYMVSCQLKLR